MRKFLFLLFSAFAALLVLSCSADSGMPCVTCDSSEKQPVPEDDAGSCDASDYGTADINGQIWMAKNFNCPTSQGSKCYDNNPANCKQYGRLYDWATAVGICPDGWHIPSIDEWRALTNYIESDKGCVNCAAKYLKSSSGWLAIIGENNDSNGEDAYDFSAMPGGGGYTNDFFYFLGAGYRGIWWSADEYGNGSDKAYSQNMNRNEDNRYEFNDKISLFSVRCLQDLPNLPD